MSAWTVTRRADGRVEIVCPHGCGHPSSRLTELHGATWEASWMSVHGCDGCCRKQGWQHYEDAQAEVMRWSGEDER